MAAGERRGFFVTLEGGDGSGKTTLAAALTLELEARGHTVCVTREPGGTELGQAIKRLREGKRGPQPLADLLLLEADRTQHVIEVIRPAMASGKIVVCDRFADSSLAYQGYGRGLDLEFIRRLNHEATGGMQPDVTLLLDVPPEVGLAREGDQFDVTGRESLDFHERVRKGFLSLAREEPERFDVIDATLAPEDVTKLAMAAIERRLAQAPVPPTQ